MRNAEGGGAPESRVVKCFAGAASSAVATCKLCRASVRRGAKGSVANLVAHLQEHHEKEFAEMVEEEAIKQVGVANVCRLDVRRLASGRWGTRKFWRVFWGVGGIPHSDWLSGKAGKPGNVLDFDTCPENVW